jgi:hypothetical protein
MVAFPELHKWRACGAPVRLCAWTPPPNPHRTPSPNPNTLTLTLILTRWEAVLVSPASERPPLLHALHVLTVQLLVVDLLAPSAVLPGSRFCATLLEALAAKLPHCPVNAYSWPEMLRMVLLARAVGQARKKRAVAMHAMISAGIGSVVVATAAAAALGGGHAVSVWSAGSAADDVDADEDGGGGAQGGTNDWAHVCDALAGDVEYEDLDVPMRCQARPRLS